MIRKYKRFKTCRKCGNNFKTPKIHNFMSYAQLNKIGTENLLNKLEEIRENNGFKHNSTALRYTIIKCYEMMKAEKNG